MPPILNLFKVKQFWWKHQILQGGFLKDFYNQTLWNMGSYALNRQITSDNPFSVFPSLRLKNVVKIDFEKNNLLRNIYLLYIYYYNNIYIVKIGLLTSSWGLKTERRKTDSPFVMHFIYFFCHLCVNYDISQIFPNILRTFACAFEDACPPPTPRGSRRNLQG